jgi:cytochrome c oxidase subunit 3
MSEGSVGLTATRPARQISMILPGTILFLASELMFFGGLFAAYFTLRAGTGAWPPEGVDLDLPLVSAATVVLMASSFTFQVGIRALRRGDERGLGRWTALTMALGATFLGAQGLDYAVAGFAVSSHAYGTIFYAMTGFHGLHVLAGLLLMAFVLGRSAQGAYAAGRHDDAEAVAYYWHFVDVVWIGLFATIYLIR